MCELDTLTNLYRRFVVSQMTINYLQNGKELKNKILKKSRVAAWLKVEQMLDWML